MSEGRKSDRKATRRRDSFLKLFNPKSLPTEIVNGEKNEDAEDMKIEMAAAANSLLETRRVKSVLSNLFQQTKDLSNQLAEVVMKLRLFKLFYFLVILVRQQ